MRIVIDLQGAQSTGSRNRGIGRYTLSLAQAMIRNKGEHEVIIALSGLFPDTIEPIRAAFEGLLPQENIRVWHASGPVSHIESANNWRRKTAELIRESFLASLQPDLVYVTSLFEGLVDDAVTSIGLLTKTIPTAVTLYDLIPLINRKPYLDNPVVESWYENKLDQLRRADLLLAISESSRQEGIKYLGFPQEQAINVGTAADQQFQCITISAAKERKVRERYGLARAFVMYTGGIDHRKNIEGLIRAYAQLPKSLRANHQLAIVCSVQPESRHLLEELAKHQGLAADEVILTGFVPEDDLIALYHLCQAFIFPSWHEGFGLPALEAMSCGAAVIAANTSSLPEVIGREDALFDPHDDKSIAEKLTQVLTDSAFRTELISHGLEQAKKFSWDESAKRALKAFEQYHTARSMAQPRISLPTYRPKLAYVSPLPPERTGIADYSAELLPELARHYEIDVIVAQETITDPWINENCSVRSVDWFTSHAHLYERVLYHFGNSPYHQHMFDLLARVPGVVVLHDFFLGHITTHMDGLEGQDYPDFLAKTLYQAHGYQAINERYHADNIWDMAWKYPCNKTVLENATGVIVHSNNSRRLAAQWFGEIFAKDWSVIPLLRVSAITEGRAEARLALGLNEATFMVCSFGVLGPNKQNQRLLDAWLASSLSKDKRCQLMFVGESDAGVYGEELTVKIRNSGYADRIHITGWTNMAQFRQYLAAADMGVQLRTLSRGETSAAVLDCMNYGLPTIVNANGSMADLPINAVWMLPDEFVDVDLVAALETLWQDKNKRRILSERAREVIMTKHSPRTCANQYIQAIENYYNQSQSGRDGLIKAISKVGGAPADEHEWLLLAQNIAQNQKPASVKQILLDISVLVQCDAKSGIQRVVRSILSELLLNPPQGYRIEPVYAVLDQSGYHYARQFVLHFMGCPTSALMDEPVEISNGDIFIGLDLVHYAFQQADFYSHLRRIGGQVYFVIYDLLPIFISNLFPEEVPALHARWLRTLAQTNGVLCISRAVADEMTEWLSVFGPERLRPFKLGWFHLGADVAKSVPTTGLPDDAEQVLQALSRRPTFLAVGTVEPRKGQTQTLAAFEQLWEQGVDANLVMIGKQGWNVDLLVEKLRSHSERNLRLFWLEGISDEYLERVYAASSCLIAASEGEGFGLPLIEAAQHQLPIIARDIPVFREVAGPHALYFSGFTANTLADSVQAWLALDKAGQAPQSSTMPWLTWKQSTQNLLDVILGGQWYREWVPDGVSRFWGNDPRLSTQVGERYGRSMRTTGQAGFLIFGPYATFSEGTYRLQVKGTSQGSNGECWLDAACDAGEQRLVYLDLPEADANGEWIVTTDIVLDHPVKDLELRVWVPATAQMTLTAIALAPAERAYLLVSEESEAAVTPAVVLHATAPADEVQAENRIDPVGAVTKRSTGESPKPAVTQGGAVQTPHQSKKKTGKKSKRR